MLPNRTGATVATQTHSIPRLSVGVAQNNPNRLGASNAEDLTSYIARTGNVANWNDPLKLVFRFEKGYDAALQKWLIDNDAYIHLYHVVDRPRQFKRGRFHLPRRHQLVHAPTYKGIYPASFVDSVTGRYSAFVPMTADAWRSTQQSLWQFASHRQEEVFECGYFFGYDTNVNVQQFPYQTLRYEDGNYPELHLLGFGRGGRVTSAGQGGKTATFAVRISIRSRNQKSAKGTPLNGRGREWGEYSELFHVGFEQFQMLDDEWILRWRGWNHASPTQ